MLDIKFIRENPEIVKDAVKNKKAKVSIDRILDLDRERKRLQTEINALQQERNIAASHRNIEKGKLVKENLVKLEQEYKIVDFEFNELMLLVPNVPSEHTPVGKDESGNFVLRKVGGVPSFSFKPLEHWQLGERLGILDIETAAKVSGSRFYYLLGDLALMEFALIQLVLSIVTDENVLKQIANAAKLDVSTRPFIPVVPPVFIRPDVMQKMGRLNPKEDKYYIPSDDLYLIGSAEHTLGPMYMDKILAESNLPLRFIGFSTAFRREAGSYGKDVKGILRVHQFDKLEMESFAVPEKAQLEQLFFVAIQEYIMQSLDLPYQVVEVCAGDMGTPNHRQIDIETWMPGQDRYRETHSSDYMTDFQSRRLNIKVKRSSGQTGLVYMNDATAAAVGRTLIAIMENNQQPDGSIKIPAALQKYIGGKKEITAKK